MAHAVHRLPRLCHRLLWWTPLGLDPTYRPITRAMAAIQDDLDGLAGARDLPTLLEQVRRCELRRRPPPHLAAPRAPVARRPDDPAHLRPVRVAAGQGDYTIDEYMADATANGFSAVRLRAGQLAARGLASTRSSGSTRSTSARAGRTRSSAPPTCSPRRAVDDARGAARRPAPLLRGVPPAAALARPRRPSASQPAPDRCATRSSTRTSRSSPELGWVFELQVFPNQLDVRAASWSATTPTSRSCSIHAGMPIAGEPWRDALHAARASTRTSTSSSPARARSSTASTPS